jgi:sterol 3beta-glucosyltransferase
MAELGVSPLPIPRRRLSIDRLEPAVVAATTDHELRERAEILAGRIRSEEGVARAVQVFERQIARRSGRTAVGEPGSDDDERAQSEALA